MASNRVGLARKSWSNSSADKRLTDQAGSATSKTGILFVYDVFGYTPQTLQGADILSETSFVVVPDFFEGNAAKKEWFARDTEEKRQNIENFMKSRTDPGPSVTRITGADGIMAELKALYPEMTWGAIGYCWGGKIVSLTSGEGSPFKAAVQTSPARLSEDDAKRTRIPMAVLASKDEDAALVKAYGENLDVPAHIETWSNSIHGWMSARCGHPRTTVSPYPH